MLNWCTVLLWGQFLVQDVCLYGFNLLKKGTYEHEMASAAWMALSISIVVLTAKFRVTPQRKIRKALPSEQHWDKWRQGGYRWAVATRHPCWWFWWLVRGVTLPKSTLHLLGISRIHHNPRGEALFLGTNQDRSNDRVWLWRTNPSNSIDPWGHCFSTVPSMRQTNPAPDFLIQGVLIQC